MTTAEAAALLEWRDRVRNACGLECRPIPWSEGRSWRRSGGQLAHETGGFFAISGVRAESDRPEIDGREQPIIVQPEIGILGMLLRQTPPGPQLLMQAKAEPGNVGAVQLAPTVQATVSNYMRLHGGEPTPYLEAFLSTDPTGAVADSLQSEQGTRFLSKYNRNVTVRVEGSGPEPVSEYWRWCDAVAVLDLLHVDFCVNTDARSTLVSSDWALLTANGRPFERWRGHGGFHEALSRSFLADERSAGGPSLRESLRRVRRETTLRTSLKPLEKLAGWQLDEHGISDAGAARFQVPMYRVATGGREVRSWDQPLVRDHGESVATLFCQRQEGDLRFLLRGSAEIGFSEKVQFGPSVQASRTDAPPVPGDAIVHAETRQSDEGGRFDHCVGTYRIVELLEDRPAPADPTSRWATLGQIYAALRIPGVFNNELRSTLALLLPYL